MRLIRINPYRFAPGVSFSPLDISGLENWYDFQVGGSTLTMSGSNVVQANDLSGNGYHVVPNLAAQGPTIGAINGHQALDFNGTNQWLYRSVYNPTAGIEGFDEPVTAFAVFVPDVVNVTQDVISINSVTNNPYFALMRIRSDGDLQVTKRDTGATTVSLIGNAISASALSISSVNHTGTTTTIRVNGVEGVTSGSQDVGELSISRFCIGVWFQAAATFFNWYDGRIGEVIVYNRSLTSGEVTQVEDYLTARWS